MPFSQKISIPTPIPITRNYQVFGTIKPNKEFYLVYSTSACKYQDWQCELLEASIKNSPDSDRCQIIKLISYDSRHRQEDFLLSDDVTFIFPEAHDRLANEKFYAPLNKPYSLKHLTEYWKQHSQLDQQAVFVLVDPDMIWYQPISKSLFPKPGTTVGQHWMDDNIMFPLLIRADDLYKIRDLYYDYTNSMYPHPLHPYITEQYAFCRALADHQIQEIIKPKLGPFVTSGVDVRDSIFLHYCQAFLYQGDKIWFKQDFTKNTQTRPWKRPDHPQIKKVIDNNQMKDERPETAYQYVLQFLDNHISKQEKSLYQKPKTIQKKFLSSI